MLGFFSTRIAIDSVFGMALVTPIRREPRVEQHAT